MVGGRGRPVMLDSEVRSPGEGRGALGVPGGWQVTPRGWGFTL